MNTTNRFDTLEAAEARAVKLEAETGEKHIGYKSDYFFEPYYVSRLPHVGDEVSMGFNGDYYPCGRVARISPTYHRITTDEGTVFTRVGPNKWKRGGKSGAFSLVQPSLLTQAGEGFDPPQTPGRCGALLFRLGGTILISLEHENGKQDNEGTIQPWRGVNTP